MDWSLGLKRWQWAALLLVEAVMVALSTPWGAAPSRAFGFALGTALGVGALFAVAVGVGRSFGALYRGFKEA
jgi:hypothetical protein